MAHLARRLEDMKFWFQPVRLTWHAGMILMLVAGIRERLHVCSYSSMACKLFSAMSQHASCTCIRQISIPHFT